MRFSFLIVLGIVSSAGALGQSAPPAITSQPASATANAGQSVTLSVTATGNPAPAIQWFKDGRAIPGATNPSLTFASVFGGDAGSYTATVSNVVNGTSYTLTTAAAVLTVVTTPPTITTQPVSQTVVAGGNVTFSVTATGSEPMLYRWYKDGVEISGATGPSLTLRGVQPSDAGGYRGIVINAASQFAAASAGVHHSALLGRHGTLWMTGRNAAGQLGNGTTANSRLPVETAGLVVAASAGQAHTFFLKSDGSLWATGKNEFGELGDGGSVSRNAPVQVMSRVARLAQGHAANHTMVIKADGTLWAMGWNNRGQLGDGTTVNRSSPVQVASEVDAVATGAIHTMLLKADGTLWGVGGNAYGQLGDGTTNDRLGPVLIASGVSAVAAGGQHTLFVKRDGSLWATGLNDHGQLGIGTTTEIRTPVQVAVGVVAVSAGNTHTVFLRTDDTLWGMGRNDRNQLGEGIRADRRTPGQIMAGVSAATAGDAHTIITKSDGTLWGMGRNDYGQIGDGSSTDRSTPVFITGGLLSNVATLNVLAAPDLTTQPGSQTVVVGFPMTLTVVATGNPAPTYQWRKAGANIPGATNVAYSIPSAGLADAGSYSVVVTNSVGSVTSSEAVVTVIPAAPAAIAGQPNSARVNLGQSATFSVAVSGSPTPSIQWFKNGAAIAGATASTYTIGSVTVGDGATYTATVQNIFNGTTYRLTTAPAVLTVISLPRLINLSILAPLATGEIMTLGTVLGGAGTSGSKALLVRGAGPSLGQLGVAGFMADPMLDLYRGQSVTASNDNWGGGGSLGAAFSAVGAFAYAASTSLDAAIYSSSLEAGGYTVQIRGVSSSSGLVLAELYDATPAAAFTAGTPRLINVSVLKEIRAGDILTAGFVVAGEGTKRVLIRAVGPTLGLPPFNIGGVMSDPRLTLYSGQQVIATNDNWGSQSSGLSAAQITTAADGVGAFRIGNDASRDAVLLVTLNPGNYTAQVAAATGGGGFVIAEVYEVP